MDASNISKVQQSGQSWSNIMVPSLRIQRLSAGLLFRDTTKSDAKGESIISSVAGQQKLQSGQVVGN